MTTAVMPFSHLMDSLFAPAACSVRNEHAAPRFTTRADILEGERDYIIRMDLPGVNREDLEIEIDGEALSVSAKRSDSAAEGYRLLRGERGEKANYRRTFQIGRGIDRENVSAVLNDGLLVLTLPKNETAVARRVEVK